MVLVQRVATTVLVAFIAMPLTVTPMPDGSGWVVASGTSLSLSDLKVTAGQSRRFYRIEGSAP